MLVNRVDVFNRFRPVLARGMLCLLLGLLLAMGAGRARAQEIEPYEFQPLPAGTNLALGYYFYGHATDFKLAGGPNLTHSGIEVNIGVARYVHYVDLAGHPAGFQVYETFGSLGSAEVGGQRLGNAFGAQSTTLSAFIWPYVNTATKTNVILVGFINPPDGSYDKTKAINVGDNRLRGTVQVGLTQGITDHLGVNVALDTQFYGDNTEYTANNLKLSQDPTFRVQVWANWRWNAAFTTSLGYEGLFGGTQQINGFFNGNKTQEQRLRANAAMFVTPRLQTMLELNHDVAVNGGFKQEFGATLRILYVF